MKRHEDNLFPVSGFREYRVVIGNECIRARERSDYSARQRAHPHRVLLVALASFAFGGATAGRGVGHRLTGTSAQLR